MGFEQARFHVKREAVKVVRGRVLTWLSLLLILSILTCQCELLHPSGTSLALLYLLSDHEIHMYSTLADGIQKERKRRKQPNPCMPCDPPI